VAGMVTTLENASPVSYIFTLITPLNIGNLGDLRGVQGGGRR
jgi:hypothetical protein